jgi:hypothetical protein
MGRVLLRTFAECHKIRAVKIGKSNARKTGGRVEFPNEWVRPASFVRLILLDTDWHRGYIFLHERYFRLCSRVCYRHCVGDAFVDCARGHGLGGASWLAQPCRNAARVHGINGGRRHFYRACHRRADLRQAALDAQPHRACGTNRALYLRGAFRGLRGCLCRTISRAWRHPWRGRWSCRSFCGLSMAHRPRESAQGSRYCHRASRRRYRDRRWPFYRFPVLITVLILILILGSLAKSRSSSDAGVSSNPIIHLLRFCISATISPLRARRIFL